MAISSDNVTTNDTIDRGIELLLAGDGIEFSAEEAHMHCMPHAVHLAAMEVDELYSNSSVSQIYINSSFHSCSSQLVHSKMTTKVPIVPIRTQLPLQLAENMMTMLCVMRKKSLCHACHLFCSI